MDSKPVLPMNRLFAEMGYNSSGLNIVPERLLLATRRPSTHYPLASGAAFFDPLRATCQLATNHLQHTAQHLATPPQAICRRSAQHLATPCTASAISLRVIRWHPAGNLPARTDALNGPQNKPSAQAGALNPYKNTFCVIVNCPLQIKPVFYFLFTSIASPTHRIRVKSSLLRLGRSCLALPFTHLGKDIT